MAIFFKLPFAKRTLALRTITWLSHIHRQTSRKHREKSPFEWACSARTSPLVGISSPTNSHRVCLLHDSSAHTRWRSVVNPNPGTRSVTRSVTWSVTRSVTGTTRRANSVSAELSLRHVGFCLVLFSQHLANSTHRCNFHYSFLFWLICFLTTR